MSAETIIRHTCDQCGKQALETKTEWLPCGGSNRWSSWEIKQGGTASQFYGVLDGIKEFYCFDCAIAYMDGQKEWERLTT